jgi:predicted porin
LNDDIKAQLQNQHNIRFGAEVRLNTIYLRGGYNWLSNPFDLTTQDATQNTYSFGIGYRQNKFTLDLGYAIQRQSINFYPYSSAIVEPAIQRITRKPLVLSASFRL